MNIEVRADGHFDPCIGGGSSQDCERGECNARAMCAAADPDRSSTTPRVVRDYDQAVSALYQARLEQGLTLAQVADRTGTHLQNVSVRLRGDQAMGGRALFEMAHALGFDLAFVPREDA